MKYLHCIAALGLTAILFHATVRAQEPATDRVSVAFSDPGKPGLVRAGLIHGSITVSGYEGSEVMVEARARSGDESAKRRTVEKARGMKRIRLTSTGLSVVEENNVMRLNVGLTNAAVDLRVQVPRRTSMKLNCINDGDIEVEGVEGEIEAENVNGNVTLTDVSGSVVAHALNGNLKVSFASVAAGTSMSFSSFNGDVDVTLPEGVKANLTMKSGQGEMFTDFDILLDTTSRKTAVQDSRARDGRFRWRVDQAVLGTINGGGPEYKFTNFNGNIYLRKAGK